MSRLAIEVIPLNGLSCTVALRFVVDACGHHAVCQGSLGGVRVLAALGGRLFSGLFRRADAIAAAMTARGFAGATEPVLQS